MESRSESVVKRLSPRSKPVGIGTSSHPWAKKQGNKSIGISETIELLFVLTVINAINRSILRI